MKVKYTHSAMPFKQMENIASFLAALMKIPTFRSFDLFSTVDLYEGKNMAQVTRCILACKRFAEREEELLARGVESLSIQKEKKIEDEVKVEVEAMKVKDENEDEKDVDIEIHKNQAILFEGDKVFHRGKALCKDDYRVILSLTFVTSREMNLWNYTMHKIKEIGIFGK